MDKSLKKLSIMGISKIARNGPGGRITLSNNILTALKLNIGDSVLFCADRAGRIYLMKLGETVFKSEQ